MKIRTLIAILAIMAACDSNKELIEADRLFDNGDFRGAAQAYDSYIKLHPDNTKAIYNRGRSYEELGDTENALADFKSVLEIDEGHVQANISMGMDQYFREKDYPLSIKFLNKALEGEKKSAKAFTLRGKAYQKLGDLPGALKDYNNAINEDKEYADAYYARGSLRVFQNRSKDACADFQLAQSLGLEEAKAALDKYCK